MRTIRLLALVMVGLALSSCSFDSVRATYTTATTATITQKKAGEILAGYNAAEAIANIWLSQPLCKPGDNYLVKACRDKTVAAKINSILDKGDPAADQLLADIKTAKAAGKNIYVLSTAWSVVNSSKADLLSATPSLVGQTK